MTSIATSLRVAVIGVDTGGTFTDVTLLDPHSGQIWTAKTPSTPDDPSRGFANGVAEVLGIANVDASAVTRVLHGTTVATNLILENKGPRIAMLVTDGFKYVVEIGRQDVPRGSNLRTWVKPRRQIRPQDIYEIPGRLDHRGIEIGALDEEAVRAAARAIRTKGITAVAIVFLHSYANAAHETQCQQIFLDEYPEALLSLSSEVVPVFREFERSMTTSLNAYVMGAVSIYVDLLAARVAEYGLSSPLMLMKSSGGVASASIIRRRPVETALSGPAAGIVGASFVGTSIGMPNLIGVDIGGTSADISLIQNGTPGLTAVGRIGEWPISLPMVDVKTIGAGGGSIACVSSGVLTVGPESAGAAPGPVCYGRGGTLPTVTDAHLALGHLPPYLLNGTFKLDLEGARAAIEETIARQLGISIERAAQGILEIADHNMVGAIRVVSVERGLDPRDFVLVPFGGAGPMHGGALARLLDIRTILLAPNPGVLSAYGLLVSNLKAEFSRTCLQRSGQWDIAKLVETVAELSEKAAIWFVHEHVPAEAQHLKVVAAMRYANQGFELSVDWVGSTINEESLNATINAFHRLHKSHYSFEQLDTPVEMTTLRVDAVGAFAPPPLSKLESNGTVADARTGSVRSYVGDSWVEAPIYDRAKFGVGNVIAGPAIITQLDATTWLLPGQVGVVDALGCIVITDELASTGRQQIQ